MATGGGDHAPSRLLQAEDTQLRPACKSGLERSDL